MLLFCFLSHVSGYGARRFIFSPTSPIGCSQSGPGPTGPGSKTYLICIITNNCFDYGGGIYDVTGNLISSMLFNTSSSQMMYFNMTGCRSFMGSDHVNPSTSPSCGSTFVSMFRLDDNPPNPPKELPINSLFADKTFDDCPDKKRTAVVIN